MPNRSDKPLNSEQLMHAMSVDDGYRVERVLARGAGGVTELVTIDGSGPFVRKKIPREQARRTVWAVLAECESRYLPKIWATYEMPERFVVVLDFVAGETLESYVKGRGALPEDEACRLIANICEAADDLHEHGVIHRDISPANIIVSSSGAHLIDLGISRMGGTGAAHDTLPFGTPGFAAPEQYGFTETDKRSDVYSIGRVLGYMLTGINPKDEGFEARIANDEAFSASLRDIVWRACEFDRSARFQSAHEMAQAIAASGVCVAGGALDWLGSNGSASHGTEINDSGASAPILAGSGCMAASENGPSSSTVPASAPVVLTDASGAAGDSVAASAKRPLSKVRIALMVLFASLAAIASLAGIALILNEAGILPSSGSAQRDAVDSQVDDGGVSASSGRDGQAGQNTASGESLALGSASAEAGQGANESGDAMFEVVESGWTISSQESGNYVHYALALRSLNDEEAVRYPKVRITGRDENGDLLFSDEQTLNVLYPGQTVYFASLAGGNVVPDTVEFTPCASEDYNVTPFEGKASRFTVEGVSAVPDGLSGVNFVGEVKTAIAPESSVVMSGLAVTVVLRDENGDIISGATSFVDLPAQGESVPFEVNYYDPPEYATVEAYAQVW